MFEDPQGSALPSIVVWIPMLDADELGPAQTQSALMPATVPQYWDPDQAVGREVARTIGGSGSGEVAWDIYLFYAPGDEWTDAGLPAPRTVLAQTAIGNRTTGVVAAKGVLPPKGDQSLLPEFLTGRADLVGTPDDLVPLLRQLVARILQPAG